jgi:hypothetical protein
MDFSFLLEEEVSLSLEEGLYYEALVVLDQRFPIEKMSSAPSKEKSLGLRITASCKYGPLVLRSDQRNFYYS